MGSMVAVKHWNKTDAGGVGAGSHAGGSFAGKKLEPGSPAFAVLQKAQGVALEALKSYHNDVIIENVADGSGKVASADLKFNNLAMKYIGQRHEMPKILQEKVAAALGAAGLLDTEHGKIKVSVPYFAPGLQKGAGVYWNSACHLSFASGNTL